MFHTLQGTSPYPTLRLENDENFLLFGGICFLVLRTVCVVVSSVGIIYLRIQAICKISDFSGLNGIPLKKQIIESSNQSASGNRCKANIRSLLSAFTSWIHPREKNIQYWNLSFAEFQKKTEGATILCFLPNFISRHGIPIQKFQVSSPGLSDWGFRGYIKLKHQQIRVCSAVRNLKCNKLISHKNLRLASFNCFPYYINGKTINHWSICARKIEIGWNWLRMIALI